MKFCSPFICFAFKLSYKVSFAINILLLLLKIYHLGGADSAMWRAERHHQSAGHSNRWRPLKRCLLRVWRYPPAETISCILSSERREREREVLYKHVCSQTWSTEIMKLGTEQINIWLPIAIFHKLSICSYQIIGWLFIGEEMPVYHWNVPLPHEPRRGWDKKVQAPPWLVWSISFPLFSAPQSERAGGVPVLPPTHLSNLMFH